MTKIGNYNILNLFCKYDKNGNIHCKLCKRSITFCGEEDGIKKDLKNGRPILYWPFLSHLITRHTNASEYESDMIGKIMLVDTLYYPRTDLPLSDSAEHYLFIFPENYKKFMRDISFFHKNLKTSKSGSLSINDKIELNHTFVCVVCRSNYATIDKNVIYSHLRNCINKKAKGVRAI